MKHNEKALKGLTSVPLNVFSLFLSLIPASFQRTTELSRENKLLLFFMKLKLGVTFSSLGSLFQIHRSTASRIFFHVLQVLSSATKSWIIWPSKEMVQETMPTCFKQFYSDCRVIIDCTEMRTEKPPTVHQQVSMYSSYKSGFTVKVLIGVSPGGLITFVSKAYGGRSSDCYITNDSGFTSNLEPGDTVMADKGFPQIRADCSSRNILLVMPPFANSSSPQFSEEQMQETYSIASVRIHVERVIQRIKIFNVLNNVIPIDLLHAIDDIVHMCCILTNLQPRIIQEVE